MARLDDYNHLWGRNENGCAIWKGAVNKTSHRTLVPIITRGRKKMVALKYFCDEAKGPLPEGLERSHTCHERLCVEPEHIVYETHDDNIKRGLEKPSYGASNDRRITADGTVSYP